MSQASKAGLVLFGLSVCCALVLAFALPRELRFWLYLHSALPLAAVLVLGLMVSCGLLAIRAVRAAGGADRRLMVMDMAISLAAITLIIVQVPARALIETDESQYLASADSIRFTGKILVPSSGVYDSDGELHPTTVDMHKRGEIYPLLLATTRILTADNSASGASFNVVAGALLLFLFARLLRTFGTGSLLVATGVMMFAAFPVVAVTIRSGMYDILNAGLLLLLALLVRSQMESPHPHKIVAVAFAALSAAQIRPEMLLVAVAGIGLVVLRELKTHDLRLQPELAFLPLAAVPGCWRFAIPLNLELPAHVQSIWGFDHLVANLIELSKWLLLPSFSGNQVVSILGLLATLWLTLRTLQYWQPSRMAVALLLLVTLPALLYSYWGQTANPVTVRYFIPLVAALTLAAVIGLGQLARTSRGSMLVPITAVGSVALLLHSNLVGARDWPVQYVTQHRDDVLEELNERYGRCNIVLVSHFPIMFITRDRGAVFPGDWDRLAAQVQRWTAGFGIHAVVAISPQADLAKSTFGALEFADLPSGPEWTRRNLKVSTRFREIWRSAEPPSGCPHMVTRTAVNRVGLQAALPLWRIAAPSNGQAPSSNQP